MSKVTGLLSAADQLGRQESTGLCSLAHMCPCLGERGHSLQHRWASRTSLVRSGVQAEKSTHAGVNAEEIGMTGHLWLLSVELDNGDRLSTAPSLPGLRDSAGLGVHRYLISADLIPGKPRYKQRCEWIQ